MNGDRRPTVHAILQTAQGWRAAQHLILLGRCLQRQVASELVMVVEIFVTLTQRIHALAQQGQLVMPDIATIAGIRKPRIDGFEQPQSSIDLSEQQQAAITGDIPARKSGLDPAAF